MGRSNGAATSQLPVSQPEPHYNNKVDTADCGTMMDQNGIVVAWFRQSARRSCHSRQPRPLHRQNQRRTQLQHIPSAVTKYVTVSQMRFAHRVRLLILQFFGALLSYLDCSAVFFWGLHLVRVFGQIDKGTLLIQFNLNVSSSGRQEQHNSNNSNNRPKSAFSSRRSVPGSPHGIKNF